MPLNIRKFNRLTWPDFISNYLQIFAVWCDRYCMKIFLTSVVMKASDRTEYFCKQQNNIAPKRLRTVSRSRLIATGMNMWNVAFSARAWILSFTKYVTYLSLVGVKLCNSAINIAAWRAYILLFRIYLFRLTPPQRTEHISFSCIINIITLSKVAFPVKSTTQCVDCRTDFRGSRKILARTDG
jgi:hypothetical protein